MPEPDTRIVVTGLPVAERDYSAANRSRRSAKKKIREIIRRLEAALRRTRSPGGR